MTEPAELVSRRSGMLRGAAALPGDKSISHRALILAAMAEGESRIAGLSEADDVQRTVAAIRALGAEADREGDGWRVRGGAWHSPGRPIDCGNSGTTARLLMGAVAGRPISVTMTGDASLRHRPMTRVAEPLRAMGAAVEGGDGLPLTVRGGPLRPIRFVNQLGSAQVKSAVLLAGLGVRGEVEVLERRPSRDHSERLLPLFGAPVDRSRNDRGVAVRLTGPARLSGATVNVPGDFSAAAFALVAALLCPGSEVTCPAAGVNPLRTGLLDALLAMGAQIEKVNVNESGPEPAADLTARTSRLRGVTVPAERAPRMIDEYPILAVAAACAEGETVMHGLGELRVKESDRLAALARGLAACGVRASAEGDTLRIVGGPVPGGGAIDSQGDHRIAMAFVVLGLVSDAPIRVSGTGMIATSFPGFATLMRRLGARIEAP